MGKRVTYLILAILCLSLPFVYAHEEEQQESFVTENINTISLSFISISFLNALLFAFLASKRKKHKRTFFYAIIIPIILTTLFLIGTTVYANLSSVTKGPVHWHADFEIWICGEKYDIIDPQGLSNKVGENVFHEHGDDRIHIEGVVQDAQEVNLEHFFEVIGSEIDESGISLVINSGKVSYKNGERCNGTVQVFVYTVQNDNLEQKKVEKFLDYIPSPFSQVPPGDCLIVEFTEEKESTEKMCESYKIALARGEIHGS